MSQNMPKTRDEFSIAIICALPLEADAVEGLFDETYDKFGQIYGKSFRDNNVYINGRIGRHDVVLCYLPNMGKGSAASAAANLRTSYTEIQLTLVVGICGGVPFPSGNTTEIVLGDVIISDSVVEYDFGGQYPDGFRRKSGVKDMLGPPPPMIRSHLEALKSHKAQSEFRERIYQHLQTLQQAEQEVEWQHQGIERDVLFEASYRHKHYQQEEMVVKCICFQCKSGSDPICDEALEGSCDSVGCRGKQVPRNRHETRTTNPFVHIGTIASADTVMKSGEHRDKMAKRDKVIGFEMEGAGVWRNMPCIIIKGVCDYADSHKNKIWQRYASATGACGAKAFLEYWIPTTRESMTVPTTSALNKLSTSFAENQNTLNNQISSMHNTVEAVSSISHGKMDAMMEMLQKITRRLELCDTQTSHQQDDLGSDSEIISSIERLCGLIQEKESTIDTYNDDQAEGIINDLQVILASAQKKVETTWQAPNKYPSQETEKANSTDIVRKIQRFNRRFARDELGINRGVQKRMFQRDKFTQHESSYDTIDIGIGVLTIRFNKRTRPLSITSKDDNFHSQNNKRDLTDYSTTVLFTPTNPQRFHMLVASFLEEEIYQDKMQRRSISSISRLAVNRVLPKGSPIFREVKMGNLSTVQNMICNDQTLLRCHDENGRSLLFYSMVQPEICKFLVENGLDVDHVAYDDNGYLESPLQVQYIHIGDTSSEKIQRVGQCYRLLLEAGADPTIDSDGDDGTFLSEAVLRGIPEIIHIAWNRELVGHFADINKHELYGTPIFLSYCINVDGVYAREGFAELLRKGANINIRNAGGETCLHKCILNAGYHTERISLGVTLAREYEALKFLVESGADPRAVDCRGIAVSYVAYMTSGQRDDCGSYPGDVWDCVLQSCGYDIAEFRSSLFRRKAKYTRVYTREVFESLWRGREEFCLYWDDSPWPPLEDGEVESSDDEEAEEGGSSDGWSTVSESSSSEIVLESDEE